MLILGCKCSKLQNIKSSYRLYGLVTSNNRLKVYIVFTQSQTIWVVPKDAASSKRRNVSSWTEVEIREQETV